MASKSTREADEKGLKRENEETLFFFLLFNLIHKSLNYGKDSYVFDENNIMVVDYLILKASFPTLSPQ